MGDKRQRSPISCPVLLDLLFCDISLACPLYESPLKPTYPLITFQSHYFCHSHPNYLPPTSELPPAYHQPTSRLPPASHLPTTKLPLSSPPKDTWETLAGYEEQKSAIEDSILLALQHPEVYDQVAKSTRRKFRSNRPRAVLFDGPPGTGKTTSARIISSKVALPLVYVPLEALVSKW